jgi:predicted N-acetyltransferase YhbS
MIAHASSMTGAYEVRASGRDALALASRLLQRVRLADPTAGLWEAADVQWWWRKPRRSDELEQLFWLDDGGPIACALLTEWSGKWQCDLMHLPSIGVDALWTAAHEAIHALPPGPVEVPARDGDTALTELLERDGFAAGERDTTTWMDAGDRASVSEPPPGFVIVDRSNAAAKPHPMRHRNGEEVEARLREGSLYDPALDLAVETTDGDVAGYSLYWFDPVTKVGLLEPMRVEEAFQRRGLARAMLTNGLDRLARRGATRLKVSYSTEIAGALYRGAGFRPETTATWYRAPA